MKKLIILCAALLAVTAFMASCKNSADYIDVTKETYTYAYTVTGTIKTTSVYGSDANNTTTCTYVQTLNNATAIVSYDENKNIESNYDNYYMISINGSYTEDDTSVAKISGVNQTPSEIKGIVDNYSGDTLMFVEVDDVLWLYNYYVNKYINIGEQSIGGKKFELKFTDNSYEVRKAADDTSIDTCVIEYDLTFTKGLD